MNTQTFTQRRAIHAYAEARRDAIYQAERQVDAVLTRIREHDASGCAECDSEPKPVPAWIYWPVVVGCSLVLTFAAYELAKLLPVIWRMS